MHSLIFVNIHINLSAVWCFSHSLVFQMIELTEIERILFKYIFMGFVEAWTCKQEIRFITQIIA